MAEDTYSGVGVYFQGPDDSEVRMLCREVFPEGVREFNSDDSAERRVLIYHTRGDETRQIKDARTLADRLILVGPDDYISKYDDFADRFPEDSVIGNGKDFIRIIAQEMYQYQAAGTALVYSPEDSSYLASLYKVLAKNHLMFYQVSSEHEFKERLANNKKVDFVIIDGKMRNSEIEAKKLQPDSRIIMVTPGVGDNFPGSVNLVVPASKQRYFSRTLDEYLELALPKKPYEYSTDEITPTLYAVHGPACAGKSTLINRVAQEDWLSEIVRSTDRKPRKGEEEGKDCIFLGKEDFDRQYKNGSFFFVHKGRTGNNRYAFPSAMIDLLRQRKDCAFQVRRTDILKDLRQVLRQELGYDPKSRTILVHGRPKDLVGRIYGRKDPELNSQIAAINDDESTYYKDKNHHDYFIDTSRWNEDIDASAAIFRNIILHERENPEERFVDVIVRSLFYNRSLEELVSNGHPEFMSIPEQVKKGYIKENLEEGLSLDEIEKAVGIASTRTIKHVVRYGNHVGIYLNNGWTRGESLFRHPREIVLDLIERTVPYEPVKRRDDLSFSNQSWFEKFSFGRGQINEGLLFAISDFRDKPGDYYHVSIGFMKKEKDENGKTYSDPQLTPLP